MSGANRHVGRAGAVLTFLNQYNTSPSDSEFFRLLDAGTAAWFDVAAGRKFGGLRAADATASSQGWSSVMAVR